MGLGGVRLLDYCRARSDSVRGERAISLRRPIRRPNPPFRARINGRDCKPNGEMRSGGARPANPHDDLTANPCRLTQGGVPVNIPQVFPRWDHPFVASRRCRHVDCDGANHQPQKGTPEKSNQSIDLPSRPHTRLAWLDHVAACHREEFQAVLAVARNSLYRGRDNWKDQFDASLILIVTTANTQTHNWDLMSVHRFGREWH
jgi:hypothetical protein